jgi:hypothetical protein
MEEPVAGVNVDPVTEQETSAPSAEAKSDEVTPRVENRDGKLFVDGVRVYSRDDTNRIAANAKRELEQNLLRDFGVDDFNQVKNVIQTLQESTPDNNLSVESLRETVKKREQTVEELQAELTSLKTQMVMGDHISQLKSSMPTSWNPDQQNAVIDLMKSRNMFELEGDTFAIRNGDQLMLDDSGERPDYQSAVSLIARQLGLPQAKTGISGESADRGITTTEKIKSLDEARIANDPEYRNAYVAIRNSNRSLSRSEITDNMIKQQMTHNSARDTGKGMLSVSGVVNNPKQARRR